MSNFIINLDFVNLNILHSPLYKISSDSILLNLSERMKKERRVNNSDDYVRFDTAEYLSLMFFLENPAVANEFNFNTQFAIRRIEEEISKYWGDFYLTESNWDFPTYKLTDPWYNSMAQGLLLFLLVQACKNDMIKDSSIIQKVFKPFELPVSDGGLKRTLLDTGSVWFEEYPSKPSSYVLNGAIFSIYGVWEYYLFTGNDSAKNLVEGFIRGLNNSIGYYNKNNWSKYCLFKNNLSTIDYHRIHCLQLHWVVNTGLKLEIEVENISKVLNIWDKSLFESNAIALLKINAIRLRIGIWNRIKGYFGWLQLIAVYGQICTLMS